jgi:hypothetical protein
LPKVLSPCPLSPQRGERVRVRGGEETFGNEYKLTVSDFGIIMKLIQKFGEIIPNIKWLSFQELMNEGIFLAHKMPWRP